jgi:hypothetical protein
LPSIANLFPQPCFLASENPDLHDKDPIFLRFRENRGHQPTKQ